MSNEKKVIRIPISNQQRQRNQKGDGYVSCEVSGRYIMFDDFVHENGLVFANVMTSNGEQERKLCELVLRYEDLVSAINNMKRH